MSSLRAVSASITMSVAASFVDLFLARRIALYGRWFDRRKASRRRRLQRPLRSRVLEHAVLAVASTSVDFLRQWQGRSDDEHLSQPAEAAQLLAEEANRVTALSYGQLCEAVHLPRLNSAVEHWFGATLRSPPTRSTSYAWQASAPTGRAYQLRAMVELKRRGGPVDIRVWLTEPGVPGQLVEHHRVFAPA
jgi:hypothetical protein